MFKSKKDIATAAKAANNLQSWYKDKYEFVRTQRDLFMLVSIVSLICSATAVAAVMFMTPYKSVEPYLIQVDQKSGIVKRVEPVAQDEFTANDAIDRYFVAKYVRARENYLHANFTNQYNLVRVMSSQEVFRNYTQVVGLSNPDSPQLVFGRPGESELGYREITFKNITFISRDNQDFREEKVVQARLLITDRFRVAQQNRSQNSIVTVRFQYSNLTLNQQERYLNPIGFLVTAYTIEREVV